MFVVRMKTNMSSTVRSQAKVQYKVCVCVCVCVCVRAHTHVCAAMQVHLLPPSLLPLIPLQTVSVRCRLKAFGNGAGPSSTAVVLLCRTEDLIGFPEIVMGAYVDVELSFHQFTHVDSK